MLYIGFKKWMAQASASDSKNTKHRNYWLLIMIVFIGTACVKDPICLDVPLELTRQDASSTQLRLNGFYYGKPFQTFEGETKYNLLVLYNNGLVLSPGAASEGNLESQMTMISENMDVISTSKDAYGVFQIHGSEILLEKWRPVLHCGRSVDYYEGQIESDTVFTFNKLTTRTKNQVISEEITHTYIFREYSPKPDSLNNFIE